MANTTIKKIHIIGIAGTTSSALAVFLKSKGLSVTGSDQEKIYPPHSETLKRQQIPLNLPLAKLKPDLVIVGNSYKNFSNTKKEFAYFKAQKIPLISLTNYLAQNLVSRHHITIAGAHGKSTITALATLVMQKAKLSPSYMFGAVSPNFKKSLFINPQSSWSIIEGDESIHGLDQKAKFLHWPSRWVLISSTRWEHKDCYPNPQANLKAWETLVKQIPNSGALVLNAKDKNSPYLKDLALCPVYFYAQKKKHYQSHLLGDFNQENIDAVFTLCRLLKIPIPTILSAIKQFKGLKRRLEKIGERNGIIFFDDFAQSPSRISQSLKALKKTYPKKKIKVFLELQASFLSQKGGIQNLGQVLRGYPTVLAKIPRYQLTKGLNFFRLKKEVGKGLTYQPLWPQLIKYLQNNLQKNDILIHLSSGGQEGLRALKKLVKSQPI